MVDSQFTWDWYRSLLDVCRCHGNPMPLRDAEDAPPGSILLRHDVDFDLAAAESLSRIEKDAGVRSSFLFLVSTDFYNVASASGRRLLRELVADGFDVGLHFDPDVYGDVALDPAFAAERAFLESITGVPLRSVSLHVPSAHQRYVSFEGLVNAYDARWFGQDRYVSDSSRHWRRDPIAFLTSPRPDIVQVLTHPIHFSEDGRAYMPQFERMTKDWRDRLHAYALRYNTTYRAECERSEP
ncbi:MAG TPA: hypothetical protein VHW00_04230 [Thermoanaerobaculia bacterium]|nr:hypothetical protein [Thermoanaerobaculia bacterium]